LTPTLIATGGTGQIMTGGRPDGAEDGPMSGANAVGSGPVIDPQQPTLLDDVTPVPSPQNQFE
jgi:hypothetical protein